MNFTSNRVFKISALGLVMSLIVGLFRLNADLFTIAHFVLSACVGIFFMQLITLAKTPNVWLKVIIGWALLFVLVSIVRDSFLSQYLPEIESEFFHPEASIALGFVIPIPFIIVGIIRRFMNRMMQIHEEVKLKNET